MKTTLQILKDARTLITPKTAWIQTDMARNAEGKELRFSWAGASCFCAVGAVGVSAGYKYPNGLYYEDTLEPLIELAKEIKNSSTYEGAVYNITRFNDNHTHEEVLALFDSAIARLQS